MSKKIFKYKNAKIYKICNNVNNECYVGSITKQSLAQRMAVHRYSYKLFKQDPTKNGKSSSCDLFDKYEVNNCKIQLVELYPCDTKIDLRKKEEYWINKLNSINQRQAYISPNQKKEKNRQYAQDKYNTEEGKAKKKEYYEEHKEIILEKAKLHYEQNKEYFKEYQKKNIEKNKEYQKQYQTQYKLKKKKEKEALKAKNIEINKDKKIEKPKAKNILDFAIKQ